MRQGGFYRLGIPIVFAFISTLVAHVAGVLEIHLDDQTALVRQAWIQMPPVRGEYAPVQTRLGPEVLARFLLS